MRVMANDLQILSTTDKRLILWNVWKILLLHNIRKQSLCIASLESETITWSTDRSKAVSMPRVLITAHWCPRFIYSIITRRYNCKRKYLYIYFPPCVSLLLMSGTVKQPIRGELNIKECRETANQSRAHYYSWPCQISQWQTVSF